MENTLNNPCDKQRLGLVVVLLTSVAMQILMWSDGQIWGGDFAQYIEQAASLLNGTVEEFIASNMLMMPNGGPVTYPWGFPLLLTPVYMLFGLNLLALKASMLLHFLSFLIVSWFIFREELLPKERLLFVAVFAFNPFLLQFGDNILSDVPFLLISTLSFLVLSRLKSIETTWNAFAGAILLGLCFAWATATRSNGILLPLTYSLLLLSLTFKIFSARIEGILEDFKIFSNSIEKRRLILHLVPLIVFTLGTVALRSTIPDHQSSHLDFLKEVSSESILQNLRIYSILVKDFFGPSYLGAGPAYLGFVLYAASIPFLLLGVIQNWKESIGVLIYVLLTLGLYIVWPAIEGLRFIFPILPFYVYFVFLGLRRLKDLPSAVRISPLVPSILLVFIFFVFSIVLLFFNISNDRRKDDGPFTVQAQEMLDFIREKIPADDVVVFRKPRVVRLLTGRNGLFAHAASFGFEGYADGTVHKWYVIDKKNPEPIEKDIEPLLMSPRTTLLFENSQFRIFRFEK
jgi:hypothetical protein